MSDERSVTDMDRLLGQRIRLRRIEIGVSQEKLAQRLGISFQQVQKYEKGVNRIAASRLLDVAHALDAPVTTFFFWGGVSLEGAGGANGGNDEGLPRTSLQGMRAKRGEVQLLSAFASIKSPRVRRRLVELVRTMIEANEAADLDA